MFAAMPDPGTHTEAHPALWGGFIAFVLLMLALDLGVFHRKEHAVKWREAVTWSVIWISISLLFNLGVWYWFGATKATEFLTAYVLEKSLSVDNIFVFVIVFSSMKVEPVHQHRVLFWGILTALILRAAMIFAGLELLERFHWLIYVFGVFLIYTGAKLLWQKEEEEHPEDSGFAKLVRKLIPSSKNFDGGHFFTVENGKRLATPLFITLLIVEFTDVIFALDSIPAVLAVSQDKFIVFTSNIFAILGLRSLYFLMGGLVDKFQFLKIGLSGVLIFVGSKMLLSETRFHVDSTMSLLVIACMLGTAIAASVIKDKRDHARGLKSSHDNDRKDDKVH